MRRRQRSSGPHDHSVAQVASALRTVGLDGFHAVPQARFRNDTRSFGADRTKIEGGFDFVHIALTHSDRSIVRRVEAGIARRARGTSDVVRDSQADNVVVVSMTDNPDAASRRVLAAIPRLVAYLRRH